MPIKLINVTKRYDDLVLYQDFSFEFPDQQIVGIMGASGSGKTTLLNLLAGVLRPDAGEISGIEKDSIAYIFQEDRLLPWKTVRENLAFVLKTPDAGRIDETLELVGLSGYADAYPKELSGGMRKRVAIARAFCYPSKLLLMDEPFSSLDEKLKNRIIKDFKKLWDKDKKTVIFVSHIKEELESLCSQIYTIEGRPVHITPIYKEGNMQTNSNMNLYHIFTMGFAGAETYHHECENTMHRLGKILNLTDYLQKLGINTILLGPLFESLSHGYDTTDYYAVDKRLGDNDDLIQLVDSLHASGMRVILDCVFNHVGRSFFAFQDLKEHRENSRYRDWFVNVNFWDNNGYNDGFRYDNWAGHDELVKLNLWNPEVKEYLKAVLAFWIDTFHIDGVRMDAANVMDRGFLRELSDFARWKKPGFFMVGEMVGGDYNVLVKEGGLDSVTNYEDYKGLYSSLNSKNYFEIAFSLNRLFGDYGIYKDFLTYNFVDNHDVNRIASTLTDERWLSPLYLMLYTMPGIPTIYYGSEQGIKGVKGHGTDAPLRPCYEAMHFDTVSALYQDIAHMAKIRSILAPLKEGDYHELFVKSQQMGYVREANGEKVYVFFNSEENAVAVEHPELQGSFYDMYQNEMLSLTGAVEIPAFSGRVLAAPEYAEQTHLLTMNGNSEEKEIRAKEDTVPPTMQDYMHEAIIEGKRGAEEGEVPIGAIIVCGGEIIARAHNQKEKLQDPTAHAEMLVIREAAQKLGRWRLEDCTLYVTAEPCPMCMGAVIQSRLGRVVYGTYESRFGGVETTAELGRHPMLANHTEIYSGICEEECQEMMKNFFEKSR